jgi:hypothetical protein
MDLLSIVAANGNGGDDFLVGLLVGCVIGVLVGPAFRSWQSYREWTEASREVRLADRLLTRLEAEADLEAGTDPRLEDDRPADTAVHPMRPRWRTSP